MLVKTLALASVIVCFTDMSAPPMRLGISPIPPMGFEWGQKESPQFIKIKKEKWKTRAVTKKPKRADYTMNGS